MNTTPDVVPTVSEVMAAAQRAATRLAPVAALTMAEGPPTSAELLRMLCRAARLGYYEGYAHAMLARMTPLSNPENADAQT